MNIDLRSLGGHLAALSRVTMRSFTLTIIVTTLFGGALGALSNHFLSEHHWAFGTAAAALALFEAAILGVMLGFKQAALAIVVYAFGTLKLGQSLVRLVFERMLGIGGENSMRVVLAPLPLAQADNMLSGAVRSVTSDEQGGWARRVTQSRLLESVRIHILQRFRAEGKSEIDLLKLKDDLERTVDNSLVRKVRRKVWLLTAGVAAGLPLLVAAQTWLLLLLLQPK
ncbi:hypothetical protein [Zavarzinella formosa]|uniref:hypothetical protein n=1 Tax=Zavarzinella formosa TaxID=360055 RepID=UPI0012F86645|nr:hypothetical protein [Zavarzinella formosa]